MDIHNCRVEPGTSIKIKRTDGRIHPAIVTGVNYESNSITVEWFEMGETKGKEVEIDALISLNPELSSEPLEQTRTITQPRDSSIVYRRNQQHTSRVSIVKPQLITSNARQTSRPTNILPSINANIGPSLSRSQKQVKAQQQQDISRLRRSTVVKEVERLKKNRDERRERQAEYKEEKEALMNMDLGNPNWEFLNMIKKYQSTTEFTPLRESDYVEDHQITVCVRKRPLSKKEISRREIDVVSVPSKNQLVVHEPKSKVDLTKYLENQLFRFDYAFDEFCTNEIVYKFTAKPLVKTVFEGGMATCFAYGQTGSGKTHTMGGDFNGKTQDCKKGIYAMVAKDVFKYLNMTKYESLKLVISASFFEIYSGKVLC